MRILLTLLLTVILLRGSSQTCTALGQNPGTALPACGFRLYSQSQVKICGDRKVPGPCDKDNVTDKNPYWYKFTCYVSGSLGLIITPSEMSDDYDWQLFDITGKRPEDVYTDKTMFVACNWSGETGKTGASSAGTTLEVCGGTGQPLFTSMPNIVEGRQYLLLVSHFTDSQSGYTLDFRGGTASITDPRQPEMVAATASCSGNEVGIKLNRKLFCPSLANDGSDFYMPAGEANVVGAYSLSCNDGFDMDSLVVRLDRVLPAGSSYQLALKQGTDRNTLIDECETEMLPANVSFTVHPQVSADFTYQLKAGCKTDTLLLSHDGNNEADWWNWMSNGLSFSRQQFSSLLYGDGGDNTLTLITGNGYCNDTTTQIVTIAPRLHAAFEAPDIICNKDKAVFTDKTEGPVSRWNWDLGEFKTSSLQHPEPFNYSAPQPEQNYAVKLTVHSATGCTDSLIKNVLVLRNCTVAVPSAFTPNNDGRNDYLFPSNGFNAENLQFRVFNRFGQVVFETRDWRRKWDGTINGNPQPSGTYIWVLSYVLRSTGKPIVQKGSTVLIR